MTTVSHRQTEHHSAHNTKHNIYYNVPIIQTENDSYKIMQRRSSGAAVW